MQVFDIFNLSGRSAIVTGAASGIGLAIAEAVAAAGAAVLLADIDEEGVRREANRLTSEGFKASGIFADVGDFAGIRKVVDDFAAGQGRLDIVFANAGVTAGPGYGTVAGQIENVDMDLWQRSSRINMDAAFVTIQSAARHMKRQRSGSIVVTASISALKVSPLPGYAYHAAKAGCAHIVRLAAKELGPHNVRVNAIAPGPFATNIAGGRLKEAEAAHLFASTVPLGRVAQPSEMKGLALLLASDASSFINGAVIPIDGGDSA